MYGKDVTIRNKRVQTNKRDYKIGGEEMSICESIDWKSLKQSHFLIVHYGYETENVKL